jgi:hypothetical protein
MASNISRICEATSLMSFRKESELAIDEMADPASIPGSALGPSHRSSLRSQTLGILNGSSQ